MGLNRVPPIVSTAWLKQELSSPRPHFRLLDTTWNAIVGGSQSYLKKHIPGALFFDHNNCGIKPLPTCARNLPEAPLFKDYVRKLGICNDSHIVVYDRTSIHASTKAWWLFKAFGHESVSVLDGGMKKWVADGYELVPGEEPCDTVGDFEPVLNNRVITEFKGMVDIVKNRSAQVVDTRHISHFLGQEEEPSIFTEKGLESMNMPAPATMLTGRIPHSVFLYKSWVLDKQTNCFFTKEKLMQLFQHHGIDLSKPLVTTCYMGHSATLINMAAAICGKDDSSLYYGSWTEYGQKATSDLVFGPKVEYNGPIERSSKL